MIIRDVDIMVMMWDNDHHNDLRFTLYTQDVSLTFLTLLDRLFATTLTFCLFFL